MVFLAGGDGVRKSPDREFPRYLCLRRRRLRLRRKGRQQTLLLLELINAPVGLLQLILLRLVVYLNGNDKRQVLQSKQQRLLGILGLSERGFVNITPQIATQTIRMVTRRAFR